MLLSSGYSIDGQAMEIMGRGCRGFIQKPFDIKDLALKLRQVLAGCNWLKVRTELAAAPA